VTDQLGGSLYPDPLSQGSPMTRSSSITLVVVVIALVALAVVGGHARNAFTYRIQFATLPTDDARLTQVLAAETGAAHVQVTRDGNWICVQFESPWWQSSTAIDVFHDAEACGYKGRGSFTAGFRIAW
jgi:hypothetical protein